MGFKKLSIHSCEMFEMTPTWPLGTFVWNYFKQNIYFWLTSKNLILINRTRKSINRTRESIDIPISVNRDINQLNRKHFVDCSINRFLIPAYRNGRRLIDSRVRLIVSIVDWSIRGSINRNGCRLHNLPFRLVETFVD